jgi:NAD(P)-dependent dehydrogenase (short-subunit alcohol dehydrogenase family)
MRLEGKVAIVTGGGSGIGAGICLCMAKEGAHVVVSDINLPAAKETADKITAIGPRAFALQTDVRELEDCERLIRTSLKEMGRIDVLVCCAGIPGYSAVKEYTEGMTQIENVSESDWNMTIDTNLKGVFLCNRAVAPYFKREKRGKIINIASIAGRRGADWIPHYSASKAGVIVLGQAIAAQLGPYNVNVNTVCPGNVWTPMSIVAGKIMTKMYPAFKDKDPKEIFDEVIRTRVPLRRAPTLEAVGHAVVFLASDEASDITGQAINVDGGAVFS